jgi:hypothetical protein
MAPSNCQDVSCNPRAQPRNFNKPHALVIAFLSIAQLDEFLHFPVDRRCRHWVSLSLSFKDSQVSPMRNLPFPCHFLGIVGDEDSAEQIHSGDVLRLRLVDPDKQPPSRHAAFKALASPCSSALHSLSSP